MTLIATPMAVDANSYVSEAEATALLAGRLYTEAWDAATSQNREKALRWATTILETAIVWRGYKRTYTQALLWPRYDVYDPDGNVYDWDTIPRVVKQACADLALELLKRDRVSDPELAGLGVVEATVGPVRAKIDAGAMLSLLPNYILVSLRHLGDPLGGAAGGSGGGVVKLRRA